MKFKPALIVAILFASQSSFSAPEDKKTGANESSTSFLNVQLTPEIPSAPSAARNVIQGSGCRTIQISFDGFTFSFDDPTDPNCVKK